MGSSLCAAPSDAIARVATPRTLTAGSDRRSGSVVSPGAIASARSLRCFFKNEMPGADLACSARQQLNLSHVAAAFFRRLGLIVRSYGTQPQV